MEEINNSQDTENKVAQGSQPQQNILFGTISYADDTAYEEFIGNMNISQAIFVLMASANFSQSRGAFNLLESETISTAIRTIRKNNESKDSQK